MRRGFTLIELMVVVTIGLLIMGSVSVGVGSFLGREKVSSSSRELESMLNLARSFAVTNQIPDGFTDLDYVAVTLTANGEVSIYPVNHVSGMGTSYVSKNIGSDGISFTQIDFGDLQFAAGSGKLVGKNADPSFISYPLPSTESVGITVASAEISQIKQLIINPFGIIDSF